MLKCSIDYFLTCLSQAMGFLTIARGKIEALLEQKGQTEEEFLNGTVESVVIKDGEEQEVQKFKDIELKDVVGRTKFESDRRVFITNLLVNLQERFPLDFRPVMKAHSVLATGVGDRDVTKRSLETVLEFYGDDHDGSVGKLKSV